MRGESFESEIQADPVEAERVMRGLRDWIVQRIHPKECFAVEILCREAVANAIEHGNRNDPSKRVRISVSLKGHEVSCVIEDEGSGFICSPADWFVQTCPGDRGRGMTILGHYADRVLFEEGGRIVRFSRRIRGGLEQ